MPKTYREQPLAFKVANIEDDTYPKTTDRLPDDEIKLATRKSYSRHTLYGLNVFLNEMFQQFPLILGLRQIDYMTSAPQAALFTARQAVLESARQTATLEIAEPTWTDDLLTVDVTVSNITGHKYPSGVSFRRGLVLGSFCMANRLRGVGRWVIWLRLVSFFFAIPVVIGLSPGWLWRW